MLSIVATGIARRGGARAVGCCPSCQSLITRRTIHANRPPNQYKKLQRTTNCPSFLLCRPKWQSTRKLSTTKGNNNNNSKHVIVKATPMHIAMAAALMCFSGAVAARLSLEHLFGGKDDTNKKNHHHFKGSPRRDASRATVLLPTTTTNTTTTTTIDDDKTTQQKVTTIQWHKVDAQEFQAFLQRQQDVLKKTRLKSKMELEQMLQDELQQAFQSCVDRIPNFADWYFAYPTTYKLLQLAITSAAKHAVTTTGRRRTTTEDTSLQAAISQDLQDHIAAKYQALVLRPALTDPLIHRAFVKCIQASHEIYQESFWKPFEVALAEFVQEHSLQQELALQNSSPPPPRSNDVVLEMDWMAQLQKVQHVPLTYEKMPTEWTLGMIGVGAATGKVVATTGGTKVATTSAATKAILAKLTTPFATKAATLSTSSGGGAAAAATGAASGAVLGGPIGSAVGAATGAAIGLSMDMTIHTGISYMQRPAFEKDIAESLQATLMEWKEQLLWPELERVHTVWFDQAQDVLTLSTLQQPQRQDKTPSLQDHTSKLHEEENRQDDKVQTVKDTQASTD